MRSAIGRQYETAVEDVQLEDLRVSVRRAGTGDAILLLHGFPHTKQIWREVEPALVNAGYQVVTPDLREIGDTDPSAGGFDALSLALDQVRLLDALSVPAAHVVGFDLGAAPAFAMAADHFVDAYTGRDRLHAAFEHYRAMPANAASNTAWAKNGRLHMPVSTVGASSVQDTPARQLELVSDDLVEHLLPDAGHIVPIDAPDELADIVLATAARTPTTS